MTLKFHHLPPIDTVIGGVSTSHYSLKWGWGLPVYFIYLCSYFPSSWTIESWLWLFLMETFLGARHWYGSWMRFLKTDSTWATQTPGLSGKWAWFNLSSGSILLIKVKSRDCLLYQYDGSPCIVSSALGCVLNENFL